MALMTKCDRCGESADCAARGGWSLLAIQTRNSFGLVDREVAQFDLCPECASSFKDVFIPEENING